MKCEFCGEVSQEDFITCPNCNSWNSEIDRTETRIYYLLGLGLALVLLVLSPAIPTTIGAFLLLPLVAAAIVMGGVTLAKLRKMKRGKFDDR